MACTSSSPNGLLPSDVNSIHDIPDFDLSGFNFSELDTDNPQAFSLNTETAFSGDFLDPQHHQDAFDTLFAGADVDQSFGTEDAFLKPEEAIENVADDAQSDVNAHEVIPNVDLNGDQRASSDGAHSGTLHHDQSLDTNKEIVSHTLPLYESSSLFGSGQDQEDTHKHIASLSDAISRAPQPNGVQKTCSHAIVDEEPQRQEGAIYGQLRGGEAKVTSIACKSREAHTLAGEQQGEDVEMSDERANLLPPNDIVDLARNEEVEEEAASDSSNAGEDEDANGNDTAWQGSSDDNDAENADDRRSPSPAPTDRSQDAHGVSSPRREFLLRQKPRDKPLPAYAVWTDKDNTGTYDPTPKKSARATKRRRIAGPSRGEARGVTQARAANRSLNAHWLAGDRLCVTLNLDTDRGRELLRQGSDNWPDDSCINTLRDAEYAADESSDAVDFNGAYNLRRRALQAATATADNTDFTGKPEGRGCRQCLLTGLHCSMRDDDGAYPCDMCINEDEDCEPLIVPQRKQQCEICRKSGHGCSYAYDGSDHSMPCEYCSNSNFKCIAGPEPDPTRARLDKDGNPAQPRTRESRFKQRRHRSCASCRRAGRHCPLLGTKLEPPCTFCKHEKTTCTFEDVKRSPKTIKKPSPDDIVIRKGTLSPTQTRAKPKPTANVGSSPGDTAPSPSPSPPPPEPAKQAPLLKVTGTIAQIKTKLSHPITFNAAPTLPCDWCSGGNPLYPLYGHIGERRTVKVLLWANKQGCKELKGGYVEQGLAPSRMCAFCTLQRVKIMFCTEHNFREVPWLRNPQTPEDKILAEEAKSRGKLQKPNAALRRLCTVSNIARKEPDKIKAGTMMRTELGRWCAVCPAPAMFECCTGDKMQCKLRLCSICHKLVAGKSTNNGNFANFVGEIEKKWETNRPVRLAYPNGLRADFGFYDWRGFLMRQVRAGQEEKKRADERERLAALAEKKKPKPKAEKKGQREGERKRSEDGCGGR